MSSTDNDSPSAFVQEDLPPDVPVSFQILFIINMRNQGKVFSQMSILVNRESFLILKHSLETFPTLFSLHLRASCPRNHTLTPWIRFRRHHKGYGVPSVDIRSKELMQEWENSFDHKVEIDFGSMTMLQPPIQNLLLFWKCASPPGFPPFEEVERILQTLSPELSFEDFNDYITNEQATIASVYNSSKNVIRNPYVSPPQIKSLKHLTPIELRRLRNTY